MNILSISGPWKDVHDTSSITQLEVFLIMINAFACIHRLFKLMVSKAGPPRRGCRNKRMKSHVQRIVLFFDLFEKSSQQHHHLSFLPTESSPSCVKFISRLLKRIADVGKISHSLFTGVVFRVSQWLSGCCLRATASPMCSGHPVPTNRCLRTLTCRLILDSD